MGKLEDKIAFYISANKELGLGLSDELIGKVAGSLGPSIHKQDSELVSCSSESERVRIRENFLKNKLGLAQPDNELDEAVINVCERMGTDNKRKYRTLFYALLAKNFGKTGVYA